MRYDVDLFGGGIALQQGLKIAHIGLLLFGHVVDVAHIGIKLCLQAEITQYSCEQHYRPYDPLFAFQ